VKGRPTSSSAVAIPASRLPPPASCTWDAVRAIQEKVAADEPLAAWIDTDDLNPDLQGTAQHYNKPVYAELGKRFAAKAIKLIRKNEAGKSL
jgi:hypothetical protein